MRMKLLASAIVVIAMTGCAEFTALKSAVGSYGSEAADETLSTSLWTICTAASTYG